MMNFKSLIEMLAKDDDDLRDLLTHVSEPGAAQEMAVQRELVMITLLRRIDTKLTLLTQQEDH